MASAREQELTNELERLLDEDASWVAFCSFGYRYARFDAEKHIRESRANEQRNYGHKLVDRVLSQPSGDDCLQLTRMRPPAFRALVSYLKQHYGFEDSRYILAEERLAISLFVLGHSAGLRLAHLMFGHSTSTVHTHFHYVLEKLLMLSAEMIRPHRNYLQGGGAHSPNDPRHSYFHNCIGAIDGTHVPSVPPQGQAQRFRNRHGTVTQNVLAVVDFNMCFTFAAAGWEGSTHDSRMLNSAMESQSSRFPMPYGDKYYLVDSGFANRRGFLAPFKGHDARYHVQEFHRASSARARQPRTREEHFNYLHSSCRNIVERCFGVLKKRFLILQRMPEYVFSGQIKIVVATMTVHNFLRKVDSQDPGFVAAMRPDYEPMEPNDSPDEEGESVPRTTGHERREWDQFRERIADSIWNT